MKLLKNRESGQALVMALILLGLGSLLIVPMLNLSVTNLNYHQLIERKTFEAYAADSGVEYALCEVYNNPQDIQGAPWQQSFVINNTTVNVTAEYIASMAAYRITSTATSDNGRSTTIETYVIIEIGLFGNAFACDGDLSIFQCDLGSSEEAGCDVYANGNIDIFSSTVDGDVTAAGTVALHQSVVTGEITPEAEVLDFPAIDPQPHRDAALVGGTTGSISWKNLSPQNLGPKYINGDLYVEKTNVTLGGTVYVTGSVTIKQCDFSGSGDIVAEGSISMDHHTFNTDNPNLLPLVMSVNNNVTIILDDGEPGTEAVVYAPFGTITLDHANVYGSVVAHNIVVNVAQIFYPASLKGRPDLPGAGLETITYGYK